MSDREKRNNRIGFMTSLGVHGALFVVLFFLMAWRAPNPPLPEYGIELNFGLDDEGSGDVQPLTPVGEQNTEETNETEQKAEAKQEEVKTEETVREEAVPEETSEQAVAKTESPVTVKEEKKEVKADVVKEKPAESPPKETVKTEAKKEEKKATDATSTAKKGDPGSHGDDTKKTGDKGSEEGTLDSKALYGTSGGGGGGNGFGLDMSGWAWAENPQIPDLPDNENGKVIFEIECDETGEITGITTLERSLSPRAEQMLKEEIRKNSLIRTSGGRVPERSKGRIVFVLRTR